MPTELQSPPEPQAAASTSAAACAAPAGPAVELRDAGRSYESGGAPVAALEGITLRVSRGELLAVVGPSGCGKTTLLELICGLQSPDTGNVRCDPAVLMPQRDLLLPWLDAAGNAALPLRIAGTPRREAREQAAGMFAELGLEGFEQARPDQLSGGMRQRVAFLRTLLAGKPLLCLDEPFGALDALTRAEMQQWLAAALAGESRTVVLVTHDVEEAVLLADRVVVLSPRPGRVLGELPVALPRPRRATDPQVTALRGRVLTLMAQGPAPAGGGAA